MHLGSVAHAAKHVTLLPVICHNMLVVAFLSLSEEILKNVVSRYSEKKNKYQQNRNSILNSIIISLELSTMGFCTTLSPYFFYILWNPKQPTIYKNNHPSTREWQIGTKESN